MDRFIPSLTGRNAPRRPAQFGGGQVSGSRQAIDAKGPGVLRIFVRCLALAAASAWALTGSGARALPAATPQAERPAAAAGTRYASARHLRAVQSELVALQRQHAARLDVIAQSLADLGLAKEAQQCRELAAPMASTLFRLQKPPKGKRPEIAVDLPEKERELRVSLRETEEHYASDLYAICRKALRAGYPSYAYQLVQEVVRHNSDHPAARRILGYRLRSKEWVTPFAADRLDKGYVWDETFGWLPKDHLARYKAGKRLFNNRWMSADQEAEIRRDFRHAWQIRTDHYLIKTDQGLEQGVEIAKTLEQYHDFFMQTFAGFFSTPEQMIKLFQSTAANGNVQSRKKPYQVAYFRTRDEYVERLRPKLGPQIDKTNGLYHTADRMAYFYYDPEQPHPDTLFHEATHQLFYENDPSDRMIALDANFWIVEGIACYMESYRVDHGQSVVGDPKHVRIEAARHRRVIDKYYVPLEDFSQMGMHVFQSSPAIARNYSQAAGLAHFFMHYERGRYRDALIEHLSEIYQAGSRQRRRGGEGVRSLAELTGVSFPELDQQYEEYMRLLPGTGPTAGPGTGPGAGAAAGAGAGSVNQAAAAR